MPQKLQRLYDAQPSLASVQNQHTNTTEGTKGPVRLVFEAPMAGDMIYLLTGNRPLVGTSNTGRKHVACF
jgi:hypothetical protein